MPALAGEWSFEAATPPPAQHECGQVAHWVGYQPEDTSSFGWREAMLQTYGDTIIVGMEEAMRHKMRRWVPARNPNPYLHCICIYIFHSHSYSSRTSKRRRSSLTVPSRIFLDAKIERLQLIPRLFFNEQYFKPGTIRRRLFSAIAALRIRPT